MTITLTREEAQSVLNGLMSGGPGANRKPIVDMMRARLSAPEPSASVEPVAWMQNDMEHFSLWPDEWHVVPLYTTPPQREWQGLTDQEVSKCWTDGFNAGELKTVADLRDFIARVIEAKLKEKNYV